MSVMDTNQAEAAAQHIYTAVTSMSSKPLPILLVLDTCKHCHTTIAAMTKLLKSYKQNVMVCVVVEDGIRMKVASRLWHMANSGSTPKECVEMIQSIAHEMADTDSFPKMLRHVPGHKLQVTRGAQNAKEICAKLRSGIHAMPPCPS